MGAKMMRREYHRNRLADKYRHYSHLYIFGTAISGKLGLWSTKDCPVQDSLYNPTLVDPKLTYEDVSMWELEDIHLKDTHTYAKKWTDKGSIIGKGKSKKWIRSYFHQQRRIREKELIHRIMNGFPEEEQEKIHLDKDRGAQWWMIY